MKASLEGEVWDHLKTEESWVAGRIRLMNRRANQNSRDNAAFNVVLALACLAAGGYGVVASDSPNKLLGLLTMVAGGQLIRYAVAEHRGLAR